MPFHLVTVLDLTEVMVVGLRNKAARTVAATAEAIAEHARQSLHEPKSGAMYGGHQASAPGEAPAAWHGGLEGAIRAVVDDPYNSYVEAGESDHPGKALALEYGRADGHFAARPFIGPAVEAVKPKFIADMGEQVGKV